MNKDKVMIISKGFLLLLIILMIGCTKQPETKTGNIYKDWGLVKLGYNHPGLLVDLDAGFKTVPMPMDFDGDGDYDLLISESGSYAESGIFYFENISGNTEMPVFRRGMKVSTERFRQGYDGSSFEVSVVDGHVNVLTPDNVREKLLIYKDVPQNVFWNRNELTLPDKGYDFLHFYKYSQWKMLDFDGDGVSDLVGSVHSSRQPDLRGAGAKDRLKAYENAPKHNQLFFLKNSGDNDNPVYEDPIEILKGNDKSLAEGLAIKPLFADFDNDGDFDYIGIGNFDNNSDYNTLGSDNLFLYFENTGTKTEYKFSEGKVLLHNNIPVLMESRATIHSTAIDWDKDGFVDIIAGDEDGKISFLKNTGKTVNGVPGFLPPRFFSQEAKYVDFGALTAPRIFDWDGDGLEDIIAGNGVGHIGFIKNLGGYPPKFDAPELLKADGEEIRILPEGATWGYTTIDVADWNHNGLPDILVNHHHGNVLWFENIGTKNKPELTKAMPVEVKWQGEPQKPDWVPGELKGNELLAPWRTSPLVMDFNDDGLNDLVMLDYEGFLSVYTRAKNENGELILLSSKRNFVFENGEPILLNQLKGSSSGRLKITLTDWDGDGLKDLIVSSKPAVDWMKNMGLKEGKMVLKYMGRVLSKTLMGHTDGPVTPDWNKDGIPDLLVGTETGVFYYWERPQFDVTSTMTTAGKQKPADYKYFKR